jgi:hypothetical protein
VTSAIRALCSIFRFAFKLMGKNKNSVKSVKRRKKEGNITFLFALRVLTAPHY